MRAYTVSKSALAVALVGTMVWAGLQASADPPAPIVQAPSSAARELSQTPPPALEGMPSSDTPAQSEPAPIVTPGDTESSAEMPPDLTQTDPDLGLPGGGASYCGPVAISNWLVHWAAHGFDRLAPPGDTLKDRQVALVHKLSSAYYMATSPFSGTGPAGVLRGLDRWVRHAGYQIDRLEYQGWRHHPRAFSTGIKQPQISWLAEAVAQGGAAWLHIGWYHHHPRYLGLRRRGGHWLTLVRIEQAGPTAELRVRDSAPYAGDAPTLDRAVLRPLDDGWLFDHKTAFRGHGYYEVTGGLHLKHPDDIAVLDGAVVLVLNAALPEKPRPGKPSSSPHSKN